MKFCTYIFVLLSIFGASCSKNTVILTEDDLPEDIFYLQDEIKPFSGKAYIYFLNSEKIKEEMNFKNGILHGTRISYHCNGQIKQLGEYQNGTFDGSWVSFCENGNKLYEVEYNHDTLEGNYVSWYSTGVIREKAIFSKNTIVGEVTIYDEAGMKISKSSN